MNRIRLLPEQVANQIAAGEVVERPASVVKELVENALDADARRITIEVQAGGRSLIRVTDDGFGMSRDDALLCLERHATSKIKRAEDLQAIQTMGFRGEALPSIASVSRFTLTTHEREGGAAEGTQVIINGGKIVEVKSAASAPGTVIEARQLFFNLPARRKFLRSEETERSHIQHYLMLAALGHPQVAFTFLHDGRVVWQLPAATMTDRFEALRERLRAVHGEESRLLAVDFRGELPALSGRADEPGTEVGGTELKLWGFIGGPGVSRSTREAQHVFVNRRPVENRGINHALLEGYHNALMKGRFPVCCLFMEVDPAEVDVNIHPAKREVKFHRERQVRALVGQAIRETLLRFHTGAETTVAPVAPSPVPPAPEPDRQETLTLAAPSTSTTRPAERALPLAWKAPAVAATQPAPTSQPATPVVTAQPLPSASVRGTEPVRLLSVPLRLVGVIGRLYVVYESDRGMVLMDQHAAHERVLYEQLLNRMEQGDAPSQRLLLPETVELPPRDAQFVRDHLATLARLGVGLSEFGERTFLLDALPPFVKVPDARRFAMELVDELKASGQEVNSMRLGELMVARTVCRHAVKANDPLAGPELENLLNDLRRCTMPYTCPHGRPTLIEMSFGELEKKFGRVV